jgi:very-short-patch-repair endonuclease
MQRKRPFRADSGIENRLWQRLKLLGFRRNATFRTFRLAFVEHGASLVIELDDGQRHIVRDRLLREAGYTVLRFPRADAVQNLSGVVDIVRAVLRDRAHDH